MQRTISSILVANRGEIACRVMRTAQAMGIRTIAVYSDADKDAMHVRLADEAIAIGPAPASDSYLNQDAILQAAETSSTDAIHPGYGFLSENPGFAERCADRGLVFIGPSPTAMRAMALKGDAKALMQSSGVPVVPGYHGDNQDPVFLRQRALEIGLPVMVKAVAGGGGKGMRLVQKEEELDAAIESAAREGQSSFGNAALLIEKYITRPRHIEVQVFGDQSGTVVHLWERDCSLQRRHQKVVEEAPAPGVSAALRARMGNAAVNAAKAIHYEGAGTVEFIMDAAAVAEDGDFYFMEMNTRLQVEHPVTEMISGQDLVAWQIMVAQGETLPLTQADIDAKMQGHAVEVRLYAEDPDKNFAPQTGTLLTFNSSPPLQTEQRIDTGFTSYDEVSIHYDPMLAKVISYGKNRSAAITSLIDFLGDRPVCGVVSNRSYLRRLIAHPDFMAANVHTGFISDYESDLHTGTATEATILVIAALVELGERIESQTSENPWHSNDGFWLNHGSKTLVAITDKAGTKHSVEIEEQETGYTAHIAGQGYSVSVHTLSDHVVEATINGERGRWTVAMTDRVIWVSDADKDVALTRQSGDVIVSDELSGPGILTAPMPGKVIKVHRRNGDSVKRGDAIVVMEAMKMEQILAAPRDGIVGGLALVEGEQVKDRAPICIILED